MRVQGKSQQERKTSLGCQTTNTTPALDYHSLQKINWTFIPFIVITLRLVHKS